MPRTSADGLPDYYATLGVQRTRPRPRSRRPSASSPASTTRTSSPATRPPRPSSRRSTRPTRSSRDPEKRKQYDELGANWESSSRPGAGRRVAGGRRRNPFAGLRAARAASAAAATSATSSGRPATAAASATSSGRSSGAARRRRRDVGRPAAARGSRPAAVPASRTSWPGWASTARRPGQPAARRATPPPATRPSEADAEIDPRRGVPRHEPAGRGRRQAPRGHDPARRRDGQPDPAAGQGRRVAATSSSSIKVRPTRPSRARAPTSTRDLPMTLEEALLGAEVPVATLKGSVLLDDPGRHPERPDVPADRPGHAPAQGRRVKHRRPATSRCGSSCRPTSPTRRGPPPAPSSTSSTSPIRADREPPQRKQTTMQLDRFTQKAQEAIVAAQARPSASTARSSMRSTSWPPSSSPTTASRPRRSAGSASTCPRSAASWPAILARRARIQGGSLSIDPRAKRVDRAGRGRGPAPQRRIRLDRAPAARRRRGRWRGAGPARAPRRRPRGDPPGAPERARRPAGHLAEPRVAPTRPSRSTAAT